MMYWLYFGVASLTTDAVLDLHNAAGFPGARAAEVESRAAAWSN